ncbi:uncharacterized protein BDR25DRAFT_188538, partial [Lindgomyces ingoldianus]
FTVEWDNLWLANRKLRPERVGYRVKHKSQLRGNRQLSQIWLLWLCKRCHAGGVRGGVKKVDGYAHIVSHLRKEHRIDVFGGGLLPDAPRIPASPFEAAREVAGSSYIVSHS